MFIFTQDCGQNLCGQFVCCDKGDIVCFACDVKRRNWGREGMENWVDCVYIMELIMLILTENKPQM